MYSLQMENNTLWKGFSIFLFNSTGQARGKTRILGSGMGCQGSFSGGRIYVDLFIPGQEERGTG